MQGKAFPSFGECIYCGSKSDLTDEHIIPFSLGATATIEQGSCKSCASITSYLDGYLARNTFYHMRVHAKVPTRREYPIDLPIKFAIDNDSYETFVPIDDHPFFVALPMWGPPGLLTGESPSTEFSNATASMWWYVPPNIKETLKLRDDQEAMLFPTVATVNVQTFARAIAKIAYCHAILGFGLNGFRPLALPDVILGKHPYASYYVGSKEPTTPPSPRKRMHQIWQLDMLDKPYAVVAVRLFSNCGTPTVGKPVYHVVVGIKAAPKTILRRPALVLTRVLPL